MIARPEASHPLSIAFFVLWLVPTVLGLPAILAALVFGRDVPRRPAVASLAASFMLSGVVYSLLLILRIFDGHIRPSAGLCAAQASLVAGLDMMTLYALVGVIHAIVCDIHDANKGESYKAASRTRRPLSRAYLLVPYVSWTVLSIVCAVLFTTGGQLRFAGNWYAANAHLPYCPPKDGFIDLVMFFVNIVLYAGAVIFSIVVLVAYIRTRRDSESWAVLDHATITRDTIVVGTLVLIMGSRVAYIPVAISSVPDLLLAATATLFVIVYGSQVEVMRAWSRWLRIEAAYTKVNR